MLVQNNIYNNSESYAILLFSMWPVLIVLLVVISCAFYGVLMHKTAICCFLSAMFLAVAGWFYG
ncbi:TPA: hypothetical protein MJA58_12700 [Klebsiella pneumoniae]|nr:hypothetical protein [Klebsiella pneumoniae]HBY4495263.1 hypothetical protein [Klebsiella pneumoniae]HBY9628163.1 hypothetical protein [Klebsiella pneumoniae]